MIKNTEHIDLQYFGDINFYLKLIKNTNVIFLSDVRYQKAQHLNRTNLIGANGPLPLTVPLIGGRDKKQVLKEVQISYAEPWQRIHWRGIVSSYKKAPWFEDYAPSLETLFLTPEKFLVDLNQKTMEWVLGRLKLKMDILSVSSKEVKGQLDSGPPKIEINYPFYQQVFTDRYGFHPNLSILDLLFCEGPMARNYLENCSQS